MITALYIVGILVIIICLVGIMYLFKNDTLVTLLYKINMCERDINIYLDNKESFILRCISIISRELEDKYKSFDKAENLKSNKVNNYERDNILSEVYSDIKSIYLDNPNLKEVKSFEGLIKDIDKNEVRLISLRTLYNRCSEEFNELSNKFPYSFICKIKKYKSRTLYIGKELNEEINKELNLIV